MLTVASPSYSYPDSSSHISIWGGPPYVLIWASPAYPYLENLPYILIWAGLSPLTGSVFTYLYLGGFHLLCTTICYIHCTTTCTISYYLQSPPFLPGLVPHA